MTIPTGFQSNLLTGLATYLQTAGLGTYSTSGAYTSAQTGIVFGTIPQQPDRIIALTAYVVDDSPSLSDSVLGVQFRCRWAGQDKRAVDDLDDAIFSLLHGATHIVLSTGVHIVQCLRNSGGSLGQDANGRWETTANYYLTVWRPSTHRT